MRPHLRIRQLGRVILREHGLLIRSDSFCGAVGDAQGALRGLFDPTGR